MKELSIWTLVMGLLTSAAVGALSGFFLARFHADVSPSEVAAPRFPPMPGNSTSRTPEGHSFIGVLVTREQVIASSRTPGKVSSVEVQMGDRVRKGQLLAMLDTATLTHALASARAALRAGQADVEKAGIEVEQSSDRLDRAEKLAGKIPQLEIAEARFQRKTAMSHLAAARAAVAGAEARVAEAGDAIADSEIRAPFDGIVAERYLDPGTIVAMGTPVARVVASGDLRVRFAVPEGESGRMSAGQLVIVEVIARGSTFSGVIDRIAPEIDPSSRMLVAEAELMGSSVEPSRLAAGLEARVQPLTATGRPTAP